MKIGYIVTTSKHNHKMTIGSINGNKIFCQYFIDSELHEETHEISNLTIYS